MNTDKSAVVIDHPDAEALLVSVVFAARDIDVLRTAARALSDLNLAIITSDDGSPTD